MDDATHREFLALMSAVGDCTPGLGALLLEFPSPTEALSAPEERLAELPPATQRALHLLRRGWAKRDRLRLPDPERPHPGVRFLPITHAAYPRDLRTIADPPPWLFCVGDVAHLRRPMIAIVGSRRASHAGLHLAQRLGGLLSRRGYLVCSGLALGIDAAAHEGALEGGATAAVLASGVDRPSPSSNRGLARRVAESGCILSELPLGTRPHRARFPRRNRVISGLCEATIIVEAALPSGSLHTAQSSLEQGRDVYVLPWSILHRGGRGCLRLLRDGATPITDLDELSEFFPAVDSGGASQGVASRAANLDSAREDGELSDLHRRIIDRIGDADLSVDEVLATTNLDPRRVTETLTDLELRGFLRRRNGLYSQTAIGQDRE